MTGGPTSSVADETTKPAKEEVIKNPLLQFTPIERRMCKTVEDVQKAVLFAKENGYKIRVRSGGHNHAGLSSGNGVMVIDVSEMNSVPSKEDIKSISGGNMVTIPLGPGATVKKILDLENEFYFPFGGCDTVCIGGFVLGGGWGRFTRYIGLGCDHLKSITLVDGNGEIKTLSTPAKGDDPQGDDPLKVFRGGGGCNLGVVTSMTLEFPKDQITRTKFVSRFEYTWTIYEKGMQEIVDIREELKKCHTHEEKIELLHNQCCKCEEYEKCEKCEKYIAYKLISTYLNKFPSDDNPCFTTACRLFSSYLLHNKKKLVVMINGYYISKQNDELQAKKEIEDKMCSLLGKDLWRRRCQPKEEETKYGFPPSTVTSTSTLLRSMMRTNEGKMSDPFATWGPIVMKKPQESTNSSQREPEMVYSCDDEHYPHIIDSAIPKRSINEKISPDEELGILELIYQIHNKTLEFNRKTTLYATFHSLGGQVKNNPVQRIFPYGNNPYIIQIQGWWEEKCTLEDDDTMKCDISAVKKWVKELRKMCREWCGGKFLNFAGFDLLQSGDYGSFKVERPSKEKWNQILSQYYGEDGLEELRKAKKIFDPCNLFDVFDISSD